MPEVKITFVGEAKSFIQSAKAATKGLQPFDKILKQVSEIRVDPTNAEAGFKALAQSGQLSADAMETSLAAINSVLGETDRLLLAGAKPIEIRQRAYQAGVQVALAYSQSEEGVAAAAQAEAVALAEGTSELTAKAQAEQAAVEAAENHERALISVAAGQAQASSGLGGLIDQLGKLGLAAEYVEKFARSAQSIGQSMQEAAQMQDVERSFVSLARSSGVAADELLGNMRRAAQGTATDAELMQAANRALLAGGKDIAEEMPRLFQIARAAAQATGQDVGYVYETLVKGIIKASPLLIDNAEVYIKVGQAVDDYAVGLGKSADDLSMAERQQALLNAVLSEGGEFIEKIGADTDAATDKYKRAEVQVAELKQTFMGWLDSLGPIGPALLLTSQATTVLIPLVLALVAAQQAGIKASLANAKAKAVETAAMWAQANAAKGMLTGQLASMGAMGGMAAGGIVVGAFAAGGMAIKAAHDFNQDFNKGVEQVEGRWGKFMAETQASSKSGVEAMDAYRAAQGRIREGLHKDGNALEDVARAYVRGRTGTQLMKADTEDLHKTLLLTSQGYNDYVAGVGRFNSGLMEGERAMSLMSQATFEFQQEVAQGTATLSDYADIIENRVTPATMFMSDETKKAFIANLRAIAEQREAAAKLAEEVAGRALEMQEITGLMQQSLSGLGLESEQLEAIQRELAVAMGMTTKEKIRASDQVTLLTQAYGLGIISLEGYVGAMKAAELGLLNLTDANIAELDAAVMAARQKQEILVQQEELYRHLTQTGAASLAELGLAEDALAEEQRQMALSLGMVTQAQLDTEDTTKLLAQAAAMGVISWKTYGEAVEAASKGIDYYTKAELRAKKAMIETLQIEQQIASEKQQVAATTEQIALEHHNRMEQIEAQAAQRRAAIWEQYYTTLDKARQTYSQAQTQAAQQHSKRMAKIEQQYQDDLERINQTFGDSLEDAEAQRNVNIYLDAVKQREKDLTDAKKKRDRAKGEETANYSERLAKAKQAYDAQIEMARKAREAQLAELQRRLIEERNLERQRNQEKLLETRRILDALLTEYARYYANLAAMRRSYRVPSQGGGSTGPGSGGGTIPIQHGFDGIVTGPQTFFVEPGVREYVYASGRLGAGASPASRLPGNTQANTPVSVTVGGTVTVDMSGFSEAVVQRWQPLLVQAAVDEVTGVISKVAAAQGARRTAEQ